MSLMLFYRVFLFIPKKSGKCRFYVRCKDIYYFHIIGKEQHLFCTHPQSFPKPQAHTLIYNHLRKCASEKVFQKYHNLQHANIPHENHNLCNIYQNKSLSLHSDNCKM